MKIDKRNPWHWLWLVLFGLNVLLAIAFRPVLPRRRRPLVLLYGHKLGGNLLAICREVQARHGSEIDIAFLTMDRAYLRELAADGESVVWAQSPAAAWALARAAVLIADHGLHAMRPMLLLSSIRFVDVWHGIPFKGFVPQDFAVQHRYDEVWVASPMLAELYAGRFGFDRSRVHVTGYARTDRLVVGTPPDGALSRQIGLHRFPGARVILFAPTWQQDDKGRSLIPFGVDAGEFFSALDRLCRENDAVLLFRAHLNARDVSGPLGERILAVPFARFPDTESILQLSDVLVCDWSSIAFDYLVLDRPTVFLDVPAPFRQGFSLGPEYRFGAVVGDFDQLCADLAQFVLDPGSYQRRHGATHQRVKAEVYGGFADGHAAERCVARLETLLARGGSSR